MLRMRTRPRAAGVDRRALPRAGLERQSEDRGGVEGADQQVAAARTPEGLERSALASREKSVARAGGDNPRYKDSI